MCKGLFSGRINPKLRSVLINSYLKKSWLQSKLDTVEYSDVCGATYSIHVLHYKILIKHKGHVMLLLKLKIREIYRINDHFISFIFVKV